MTNRPSAVTLNLFQGLQNKSGIIPPKINRITIKLYFTKAGNNENNKALNQKYR